MSRQRIIKPDFWPDEDIATVPFGPRLYYIALWNFSSDEGIFEYSERRLKNQIFPYDDIDIAEFTFALTQIPGEVRKVIIGIVNNKRYGFLPNFLKHQTINRPTPSPFPKKGEILKHAVTEPEILKKVLKDTLFKSAEIIEELKEGNEAWGSKPPKEFYELMEKLKSKKQ